MVLLMILSELMIGPMIRAALLEDLGLGGDITAQAVIPENATLSAQFRTRQDGVLSGIDCARLAMTCFDPTIEFTTHSADGTAISKGDVIATVTGPARSILGAERVALNFMGHMSGIATLTAHYVRETEGTRAKIAATRKTLPNLRAVQKYAVQCGGGMAHRYRLDDCILIKDNHVALCGGDVAKAVEWARKSASHTVKIELEVDSLAQLKAALPLRPDIIMLDNFSLSDLKTAVDFVAGSVVLEASGGVNIATVRAIAETGVDIISVGALTHSAPNLDIGLDA
jgi:nicotinate-nucleotide pyrophosphorylase (carboxylating)